MRIKNTQITTNDRNWSFYPKNEVYDHGDSKERKSDKNVKFWIWKIKMK